MFDINKFTHKSQEAVQNAILLAQQLHHQAIEPEHLAVSLLGQDGLVPAFLKFFNIDTQELIKPLRQYLERKPAIETTTGQGPHVSPRLDTVLSTAQGIAKSM
ncbi:MAG: type VI secretion system ATPase TssH, partial [Candidatus Omnitrophica bacterium]|nr:type VI secretion system ATPase TssH [Candidatus Omnitrophota bacterium]